MIQCVDSREEPRDYCSRICCQSALKNSIHIKKANPEAEIYIFYRDMMAYGFIEKYYTEARRMGVVFIPYYLDRKPLVMVENGIPVINAFDPILGRDLSIRADILVLSTGIIPCETDSISKIFNLDLDDHGFLREGDPKWRPVDSSREGIFICGLVHSPRTIGESIAMAEASAQRALRILHSRTVNSGYITAQVRHSLCSLCEKCIMACPYHARYHDMEEYRIVVNELMCQGCGSCSAVCPNSASVLRGYRDQQIFEIIDSAIG
jgi:heterodisulfide reductase subunit A